MTDEHPSSNSDALGHYESQPPQPPLDIHVDYDLCVNYAMQQNDVPVVKLLSIGNHGTESLADLTLNVWIDHGISQRMQQIIGRIGVGETWTLDTIDLSLHPSVLLRQEEREAACLHVEVTREEEVLGRRNLPIDILAHNEWGGLASLPEILAAFVMPNQGAVERILGKVRDHLQQGEGDGSIDGYQRQSAERVRQITQACYLALRDMGIGYINPPASFEAQGQKIRSPGQIENGGLATCLDLALLTAGCLEQCGLHPLVFMLQGHAFAGVWTGPHTFPEPAVDDAARMRKRIHLGDILAFETTGVTSQPAMPFEVAEKTALRHLEDSDEFVCAIDIRAARKLRIRPLPSRDSSPRAEAPPAPGQPGRPQPQGAWDSTIPAGGGGSGRSTTSDIERFYPADAESDELEPPGPESRLDHWKNKLLDLSLRNKLLSFRPSKKTVPLMVPDIGELEDALAGGKKFTVHPRPALADPNSPRDLGVHQDRTQEDALGGFLRDDLRDGRLHADIAEDDLDKRLLGIYRQARNDLEETGANTLFLAVGFLEWYESDASEKKRLAPIILLPLQITRQSIQQGFKIREADDDPRINVTLLKKIEKDFNVDVSRLGELPEDDSGLDVHGILQGFRHATVSLARWDVVEKAQIGLFSFSKFLMWQDLEEHADALLSADVVRHLVERAGQPFGPSEGWPEPKNLDQTRDPANTLCPLDADSSQLAAIFAAEEGKTFVLQGPPGTGKSQTITNLIAHTLGLGKRVLFVAEKMAALNVVYDRLTKIGLASACLEIHSNKANKLEVLNQISVTLNQAAPRSPAEWTSTAKELQTRKRELNGYVEAIHEQRSCGCSVFQATSQLIGLSEIPLLELDLGDVENITLQELQDWHELLERLATAIDAVAPIGDNPLAALDVADWHSGLTADLKQTCQHLQETADAVARTWKAINQALDVSDANECNDSQELLSHLTSLCSLLLKTPGPQADLLTEPGWTEITKMLKQSIELGRERDAAQERLLKHYAKSFLDEDAGALLGQLQRARSSFFLFRWFRMSSFRRGLKHHAKKRLPGTDALEKHLENLVHLQEQSVKLGQATEPGQRFFGRHWQGGRADWDALLAQLEWADRFRKLRGRIDTIQQPVRVVFRSRCIDLATSERDQVLEPGPNREAFQSFELACAELVAAKAEARDKLQLDTQRAFGDESDQGHLGRIQAWASAAETRGHTLRDWCHWRITRTEACQARLLPLVQAVETGGLDPDTLQRAFDRAFFEAFVNSITDSTNLLRRFSSHEHTRKIESFRILDKKLMQLSEKVVQARLAAKAPRLQGSPSAKSEMGILARQLKLKRRHLPIRRLFEKLPNVIPRLKPCLLMSPLSVAQYLSASYPPADLVIFDEASQIPVWDAIGALARGKSAIVVGDSKQLPPTSFFQRMDDDDESDEDTVHDLESILDECEACGITTLHLDWHYRSRHESLISFSNHHYYDNKLLTFPSAASEVEGLGVSLRYFEDGVYDKGRSRTNKREAEAIRDEILLRLKAHKGPGDPRSIGVVAFSQAQQNLIEDLMDEARRLHPEIERYFSSKVKEPVFIKNLENVQGDERDTILFSICYGPDLARKMSMAFGPLNRQGGERRLNVAITRARCEVVVFSSIRADDIDLRRTQALGVKHLRTFLDYASRGNQALAAAVSLEPDADFDSPFEKEVHAELVARGHDVDIQVGCSGYRIDLAVRHPEHPGQYILGIECDGASYHSGATARDRDRLRQSVLEGLGWTLHRIWSTDWWDDPRSQIERVEEAIAGALRSRASKHVSQSSRDVETRPHLLEDHDNPLTDPSDHGALADRSQPTEDLGTVERIAGAPQAAADTRNPHAAIHPGMEAHDGRCSTYPPPIELRYAGGPEDFYLPEALPTIAKRIKTLVQAEAPMHFDRLCREIIACWSLGRIGSRIRHQIQAALGTIPVAHRPVLRRDFVWASHQNPKTWDLIRIPAANDPEPRKVEELPPVEIANGAKHILQQQIALPLEDLERETARLFGISRVGKKVKDCMNQGITLLEMRGDCKIEDGQVVAASE